MTIGHAPSNHRSRLEWLALVAILISAFSLRIYDLNWDQGKFLHPDELFVTIRSNDQIHFSWPPIGANQGPGHIAPQPQVKNLQ